MPTLTIPEKLLPLIQEKRRYKIVIGGRGSGKSQTICDICLMDSQVDGLKVGCFREFQNSIEDSVHSLLKGEIDRLGLQGFTTTKTAITNGSGGEFKFKGLARDPSAIKSMHGFRRFFVEEAQTISDESLKLLTPTLREEDSEIWMAANPMSREDPFSQRFIIPYLTQLERDGFYADDMHLIIVCNYTDNPFFPQVLEEERAFDEQHLSTAQYEHIWLGKFLDTVENAIIRVEWVNAAIDAHEKLGFQPTGAVICAHDPSDEGPDPKGCVVRHGSVIIEVDEMDSGDSAAGMDWALDIGMSLNMDVFRWDCDGLGVSLKRQASTFLENKGVALDMFKGSEAVDFPSDIYQPTRGIDRADAKSNEQTFRNKRAQYYWAGLRDRLYATYEAVTKGKYINPDDLLSISSRVTQLERFRSELCRIPKKYNANGMIQIMSKEDMRKLKPPIASPNLADSGMMSCRAPTKIGAYQVQRSTAKPVRRRSARGWT